MRSRYAIAAFGLMSGLLILIGPDLRAQGSTGGISGIVKDSSGVTIGGSEVILRSRSVRGETDENGAFSIENVPVGPTELYVRRIGFRPDTIALTVYAGTVTAVEVILRRVIPQLQPVLILGRRSATGRVAEFYARKDRGMGGRFITRSEIERQNPVTTTDLFRMIPGAQVIRKGIGTTLIRFRGNSCPPLVWLDGAPLLAGEFDLDALSPLSLEGIEIYSGISSVPAQFTVNSRSWPGGCGTIVIWSREGQLRPKKHKGPSPSHEVADMVDQKKVFTADSVDVPARQDTTKKIVPIYPDSLYEAGIPGTAVVEFVVDITGEVDPATFSVISTTHRAFAESVAEALKGATFIPASKAGHPVAQVVQQRFEFAPDPTKVRHRKK